MADTDSILDSMIRMSRPAMNPYGVSESPPNVSQMSLQQLMANRNNDATRMSAAPLAAAPTPVSNADIPAAFLGASPDISSAPDASSLTSGRTMEGKSRQSIDDILNGLYASQKQQEGTDQNLAWMQFFSKMASSPSSSFLGAAGAGADALSNTMQAQETARRQNAQSLGLNDIKYQQWLREQTSKEEENKSEAALRAAQAKYYDAGGGGNATIKAANALMAADPTLDFPTAFNIAKSGVGQGRTVRDGEIVTIKNAPESAGAMKYGEKIGENRAELDVKKEMQFPKATAAYKSNQANTAIVLKNIDSALPRVNSWTSGLLGSSLDKIPGTDARDLRATLDSVKASAGFDALQEMRDNSPTGGALGQVSDFENKLLQAKIANIEQSQSPEQLASNLRDFRQAVIDKDRRVAEAYKMDFGKNIKSNSAQTSSSPDMSSLPPDTLKAAIAAARAKKAQGAK